MSRTKSKNQTARRDGIGDAETYLGEDFGQRVRDALMDDEHMARIQADLERRGVIPELEMLFFTRDELLRALLGGGM